MVLPVKQGNKVVDFAKKFEQKPIMGMAKANPRGNIAELAKKFGGMPLMGMRPREVKKDTEQKPKVEENKGDLVKLLGEHPLKGNKNKKKPAKKAFIDDK